MNWFLGFDKKGLRFSVSTNWFFHKLMYDWYIFGKLKGCFQASKIHHFLRAFPTVCVIKNKAFCVSPILISGPPQQLILLKTSKNHGNERCHVPISELTSQIHMPFSSKSHQPKTYRKIINNTHEPFLFNLC